MVVSNELNPDYLLGTATMMFELAIELKQKLNVTVEFINLGGGLGLAYRPEEDELDLAALGEAIRQEYQRFAGTGRPWQCRPGYGKRPPDDRPLWSAGNSRHSHQRHL